MVGNRHDPNFVCQQMKMWGSGHSSTWVLSFALHLGSHLVLTVAPSGARACRSRQCSRTGCGTPFVCAQWSRMPWFWPRAPWYTPPARDGFELFRAGPQQKRRTYMEMGEEESGCFFPSWDFKCKENRTFWINGLFEAVGVSPFVLALQN